MDMSPVRVISLWLFLCCVLAGASSVDANTLEDQAQEMTKPLIIATRHAPPFSIKTEDGWQGITIDLIRHIGDKVGFEYEFRDMEIDEMLAATANGEVAAAAAALTITADREKLVDFSHPFLTSGLGIAVPKVAEFSWLAAVKGFVSAAFLKTAGALLGVLTLVGVLLWLAERKQNEQFAKAPIKGVGAGVWWSAVTMTTVGYGDKAPKTFGGRVIGLIWMFASIIIISSFTAAIATSLTVGKLEQSISSIDDLYGERVVTVKESTSSIYLREQMIRHKEVDSIDDALQLLANGEAAAMVYDMPILRYEITKNFADKLRVLPSTFVRQDYGIALPTNGPNRELLNQEILSLIDEPEWMQILDRYLGVSRGK